MSIESPKIEGKETREIMQTPEIEIKNEKGTFLLSVLLKGYNPEWGNQKHPLVEKVKKYYEKNPLDVESVDFFKSIKALEDGGIDEESLFTLSEIYGHPERHSDKLARDKEGISKDKAEELKNGLFKIFQKLDKNLVSSKSVKEFERVTKKDIKARQEKMPETRKLLQGVIDFFQPSPETTKVKKVIFNTTNFLWNQESGRGVDFGEEFIIDQNVKAQDSNPHEFMHSIINPITEKLEQKLTEEQKQRIIEMSPGGLKAKSEYGEHWYSLLNESLIRTYVNYFSKGERPDLESFKREVDQIKDEEDFQEKLKNLRAADREAIANLGVRSLGDFKSNLQKYFDTQEKNEFGERVYDFYQKYAEAQKSDPSVNFEDYLQQNYEELVK